MQEKHPDTAASMKAATVSISAMEGTSRAEEQGILLRLVSMRNERIILTLLFKTALLPLSTEEILNPLQHLKLWSLRSTKLCYSSLTDLIG